MNPAEAAEEAPSDPDTDAFYKTGKISVKQKQSICFTCQEAPGGAAGAGERRAGGAGDAERSREPLRAPVEGGWGGHPQPHNKNRSALTCKQQPCTGRVCF